MRGTELRGLGGEEDTQRKKPLHLVQLQTGTGALVSFSLSTHMASGLSES